VAGSTGAAAITTGSRRGSTGSWPGLDDSALRDLLASEISLFNLEARSAAAAPASAGPAICAPKAAPKLTLDSNCYCRLTTKWKGDCEAPDVINDGRNNRLIMAKGANVSGQAWKLTKTNVRVK
jgi:hypothetical protein